MKRDNGINRLRLFINSLRDRHRPPTIDFESVVIDWELPHNLSSAVSSIFTSLSYPRKYRTLALQTAKSCLEWQRYEILHSQSKTPESKPEPSDMVDHPDHYSKGRKYEPIEVIEDWNLGFHIGNALKYISRVGRKDDAIQDIDKAIWYLQRAIDRNGR